MKIAMLRGPRDVRLEEHPVDASNLKPDEALAPEQELPPGSRQSVFRPDRFDADTGDTLHNVGTNLSGRAYASDVQQLLRQHLSVAAVQVVCPYPRTLLESGNLFLINICSGAKCNIQDGMVTGIVVMGQKE